MAAGLKTSERNRALKALDEASAFVQGAREDVEGDALAIVQEAGDRIQQANAAFVLALLKNEDCPAAFFKPWASVRRIRDWRDAGKLRAIIRHGRICVKPSDFFEFWNTLPDESQQ